MNYIDVCDLPGEPKFEPMRNNPPDKILVVENSHCSLWWKNTPSTEKPNGLIGHFHPDSAQAAATLLKAAEDFLKKQGCLEIIGPMDGNTWKPYRLVSWSDNSAPFFMEPQNPTEWPEYWQDAGFTPYHEYISSVTEKLQLSDPRLPRTRERLKENGISWRCIQRSSFEADLRQVFKLSLEAFSQNILYTPISKEAFLQQYLPYADKVDTDFMLIAEDKTRECCGFVFAIPDYQQLQRGEQLSRLIVKTLAVSAKRRSAGLGSVLVEAVQKKALEKGFTHAIHALMYSQNNSANIGKYSRVMRRYTLYKKNLL